MDPLYEPWPDPDEALRLPREVLAVRILDRLANSAPHDLATISTRQDLISREALEAETARRRAEAERLGECGRTLVISSQVAIATHSSLARALGEAWDYSEQQGWLAEDPSHPGRAYVTASGRGRVIEYRTARTTPTVTGSDLEPQRSIEVHNTQPQRITAFLSWAHEHADVDPAAWAETVFRFTAELRRLGIDADIDLAHQHDDQIDWTVYGVQGIERADYVLIIASSAYKERWEGTGSPLVGAGAAREANALKAQFDRNRERFKKKIKVILLPGVAVSDIPLELQASQQRFTISSFDEAGLGDLLRMLTQQPEWVMPEVGDVPELPPRFVEGVVAVNRESPAAGDEREGPPPDAFISSSEADAQVAKELRARLEGLNVEESASAEDAGTIEIERGTIRGALGVMRGTSVGEPASRQSPQTTKLAPALDPALLQGRIYPYIYMPSIDSTERAFCVRSASAFRVPQDQEAVLATDDEDRLLKAVSGSRLEAWVAHATSRGGTAGATTGWRSIYPTTSSVITLQRPSARLVFGGWTLESRVGYNLQPHGSTGARGMAWVNVDVTIRPEGEPVPNRWPLGLDDLFALTCVELSTLLDDGLASKPLAGINDASLLAVATVAATTAARMSDFVLLLRPSWRQVEGAVEPLGGEWSLRDWADVEDPTRRCGTVRGWIKVLLRNAGISGHEVDVDALSWP